MNGCAITGQLKSAGYLHEYLDYHLTNSPAMGRTR
jgi:hypothetical protein